ncbi:glycoside hydrolase family 18 protein [Xanthomonas albilineans]|uniref:glycoside hydrolase family 18 protein n=2 Tax=Xanthomonas albilineans TaxID=29447 RepID=UPI0031BA0DEF
MTLHDYIQSMHQPRHINRVRKSLMHSFIRAPLRYLHYSLVLLVLFTTCTHAAAANAQSPRLVGYFTQWSIYGSNYQVRDIATSGAAQRLTHLHYAFGNVRNNLCEVGVNQASDPSTGAGGDAYADYTRNVNAAQSVDGVADTDTQPLRGNWNQLRKLKAMYPHLKVVMALGGWSWSSGFASAARPENRQAFVASCIDAYIRGNLPVVDGAGGPGAALGVFDGFVLDWEFPVVCGLTCGTPEDRANYTGLIAEFRRQLDAVRPGLLLAVDAGAGIDKIRVTDPGVYQRYLDYIDVMTYDFHGGSSDATTNHHSALFHSPFDPSTGDKRYYNSTDAILAFLKRGVPAHKLNLGIGFYGQGWKDVANINNGLYQAGNNAGVSKYNVLKTHAGNDYYDHHAFAHWKYDKVNSTFWSYDDPAMANIKGGYVKALGLGGAFFWELSGDDEQGGLLNALYEGLH